VVAGLSVAAVIAASATLAATSTGGIRSRDGARNATADADSDDARRVDLIRPPAVWGIGTPSPDPSESAPPSPPSGPPPPGLYVSPGGSDSNPGTFERPLRSLQKAADKVKPGTVVRALPGSYGPVASRTDGTVTARIVFLSTTPRGAKIVTSGTTSAWSNRGDYVDIVGFEVSAPAAREGIISEASHVRVLGVHVYNTATAIGCTNNGGAAINHGSYTGTDNEVSDSWVHDIGPAGCGFVQGIYVSQSGGRILNNVVYRVAAWGIHTWHAATGITIANNLVFGARSGAIVVGAGDNPPGILASNFLVANNMVLDSGRGIVEMGRVGDGNRFLNNLVFRAGKGVELVKGVQSATRAVDPVLLNYQLDGTGNYHPGASSPAVDGGTATGAPAQDIDGVPRPRGKAPDIGPYEQ
jgi:hypothetical protein